VTHPERARDYLGHIADAIERARRYAAQAGSLKSLEQDELVQDAIVPTLAVIGEAAYSDCRCGDHPRRARASQCMDIRTYIR
jgi:uncharacterized protein with HEPN domain